MEKDEAYANFKYDLAELHKQGYRLFCGEKLENYDQETGEHFFRIALDMTKKMKCPGYLK